MYDLERFLQAQELAYPAALAEIRSGRKCSCWMWYIFPQLKFLGYSDRAKYYGILNLEHARSFLAHPLLGMRLREISDALLQLDTDDALQVMGSPDDMKLRSCMTLFNRVEGGGIFEQVLNKYFDGRQDQKTLEWLDK